MTERLTLTRAFREHLASERSSRMPPLPDSFDGRLGRNIIELHVWAVGEGLRGTEAAPLFDGLCQRLIGAGVPLWRGFAGMRTLHPQWGGYGYTWWRQLNAIQPQQFERGNEYEQGILTSPIGHLIRLAEARTGTGSPDEAEPWLHLRRRLAGPDAQLDFPSLAEFAAAGATDYFAEIVRFGAKGEGDPSRGTGIGYSFITDRPGGFTDARLSHLDYSREMALVAQHDGMTLGVARYSADPDRRSAEFAVAVRSDWHGRRAGQLLMARLIEAAQQSGISELVGLVLRENNPMLNMCRKLGFSIPPEPNDAAVLRVRKSLASV